MGYKFPLIADEKEKLVANCDHLGKLKYTRSMPNAFTEHGVLMVASILNSPRAVDVSLLIVRTFIQLRQMLLTHKELANKLAELEDRLDSNDEAIYSLVSAVNQLMEPKNNENKRPMGFAL